MARADREFVQKSIPLTGGVTSKYGHVASFMAKDTNGYQETPPESATVVPIIGMSDQMNLTNFCRDKKSWPVYITIGNLPLTIHNRPASMAILPLEQLPIPPKPTRSSRADKLLRLINANTLCAVFEHIFTVLEGTAMEGAPCDCADGKIRRCFLIMLRCIVDHMENVTIHGIKSNTCSKDEGPLGEIRKPSRLPSC